MSGIRRHLRVIVDGTKHEVVTSARDIAEAEKSGIKAEEAPTVFTLAVAHASLLRLKAPGIPTDLGAFMDLIDDFDDLEGEQDDASPTRADR